jgi:hypothetical protein
MGNIERPGTSAASFTARQLAAATHPAATITPKKRIPLQSIPEAQPERCTLFPPRPQVPPPARLQGASPYGDSRHPAAPGHDHQAQQRASLWSSVEHRTPGNLRAFIQAKLRNLRTGAMFEHRFRSPDPIERVVVDEIPWTSSTTTATTTTS